MPVARQITMSRSLLILFTGILVGVLFSATLERSGSGNREVIVNEPVQSSVVTRRGFVYPSGNYANARPCSCSVSSLSFPLKGVASPYESAIRFAAANEASSDKVTLHSYHLMYGPFLAPYLHKNLVSVNYSSQTHLRSCKKRRKEVLGVENNCASDSPL